jgi:hypothetical protein
MSGVGMKVVMTRRNRRRRKEAGTVTMSMVATLMT